MTMMLNDRALLVSLSISQWTARKLDKRATKEVADNNRASTSAGRYNKSLLPLNDLLAHVHQKTGLIREKFAKNTLPWGIDGTRILPSANYLSFMQDFRKEKSEWQSLVTMFIDNYDDLVDGAKRWLGDLYDEKDYPTKESVADKFALDMGIFPVPTSDFRVQLSSDELTRLQEEMEERMVTVQQEAMMDAWGRLYKHVQHITEKLADPKGIFRDSMLDNAQETCDLLTRLNIADDPNLEAMRREVEAKLISHHPDSLRNDPDLRQDTAAEARKIMDLMSTFMQPG
jgi:hypothetical protein